jgi:hypothetical protein
MFGLVALNSLDELLLPLLQHTVYCISSSRCHCIYKRVWYCSALCQLCKYV